MKKRKKKTHTKIQKKIQKKSKKKKRSKAKAPRLRKLVKRKALRKKKSLQKKKSTLSAKKQKKKKSKYKKKLIKRPLKRVTKKTRKRKKSKKIQKTRQKKSKTSTRTKTRSKKKSFVNSVVYQSFSYDQNLAPSNQDLFSRYTFIQDEKKEIDSIPPPQRPSTEISLSRENLEFWAYLESFLKDQRSPHTRKAYEYDIVEFLAYMKAQNKPMNVHTLVEYRHHLEVTPRTPRHLFTGGLKNTEPQNPISKVSINRKLATLKSFLNWLVLNGLIPNNPAKAVKSFRAGRESPTKDISDAHVKRMLELPSKHSTKGALHGAILHVLFHLGLRRSELIALKTSDLFEQSGYKVLRVLGKGDKERILPLSEKVYQSICHYLDLSKKNSSNEVQPLFSPTKNNVTGTLTKPLHPNAITYIIKKYAQKAGVNYRVSPHSARATAVSNALDHKATHRAVQHMAGWSNPLMVGRYDKRAEDLKSSATHVVDYEKKPSQRDDDES